MLRRLLSFSRPLAGATAFSVFCGAAVLPVVHDARVALAEEAFHQNVHEPSRRSVLPRGSGHKHHDEDHCAACRTILLARGSTPAAVAATALSPAAGVDSVRGPALLSGDVVASRSRAPPAAA